ncbi:alpha/beta fold hydrolase [Methylosinus sp. Sm6]|uniref:alpha/beta fold hydrolase n=1 Tax=Methylosinus sp. Sm6 TaxID=2866948 RepID=UPI001C9A2310|nr:alpha/beta hydrolase [Methylosinus sp. Sm6]MBY6241111.1 alpha/beta hydrolase [Methylosinus sp. Sm6]
MLLLHGNPANLDDWSALAPLLDKEHEIVAIDLPGFGKSKPILRRAGESRLDVSARCIVALADRLGWHDPFFIVGHSHGAAVAQVVAARYPARIEGVALIATLGSPAHSAYRLLAFPGVASGLAIIAALLRHRWLISLFRRLLARIMRPIYQPAPLSGELVDQRLRDVVEHPHILVSMADAACGGPSEQLLHGAEKIRAPALFLHGEDDALTPVAYAHTLFAAIQGAGGGASFEVISGAGHMLHTTHAADVNRRISEWIRRVRQDRATGTI